MKKLITVSLALGFLITNSSLALAAKAQPEKTATPALAQKQASKTQELITKKKAELNGTQWSIESKSMLAKSKAEKDVLSFMDGKVISKNLEAKGFEATNFSMRLLEDNETYTWETMQVSEKNGTAFWRGDIGSDGIMRGVLSIRDKKERISDYNFHSLESTKTAVVAPVVAVEPPVVAVEPSVAQSAE